MTNNVGALAPAGCRAIHVNTLFNAPQPGDEVDPSPLAARALEKAASGATGFGYAIQQGTRPQTLGYRLTDSPAGQAAWIYEKFQAWTDNPGDAFAVLTRDEMLDDIMLYWLTNAGASSARLYWESLDDLGVQVDIPVAVSVYLNHVNVAPREWAERSYSNIVSFRIIGGKPDDSFWAKVKRGAEDARAWWSRPRAARSPGLRPRPTTASARTRPT